MDRRHRSRSDTTKKDPASKPPISRQATITSSLDFLRRIKPALRTFYWTLAVRGVSDISTAEQTFQAQIYVEYYMVLTEEEIVSLSEYVEKGHACTTWRPALRPSLCFKNDKEVVSIDPKESQFYELNDGGIMCMIKDAVQVTFNEALELENFPFDVQDLTMTFADFAGDLRWSAVPMTTETWYKLVKDAEDKSFIYMTRRYILDTEWDWLDIAVDFDRETWDGVTESTTYVAFKVQRQWVYYFWRVYFVLALLSFVAVFPLRLEEDDRPDQLSFISTILLTVFVYQIVLSNLLPKLPYLTILDRYVLFSLGFCLLVGIEIMIPLIAGEDTWTMDYDTWSSICLYTDLGIWVSFQLYHVFLGWYALGEEAEKVKQGPLHEFRTSEAEGYWIMDIPNEKASFDTCFLTKRITLAEEYADSDSEEGSGSAAKAEKGGEQVEMTEQPEK